MNDWTAITAIVALSGFFGFLLGCRAGIGIQRRAQRRQPITIELLQTEIPVEGPNGLRGMPVYFWQTDERSVSFYPAPDAPLRLCVRR